MGAVFFLRASGLFAVPERLPRKGRASGGIYACEAAAMRRASLVAHLGSSSVQEPPAAVDLRHFSLRLVVQALTSIATKKRPLLRSLFSLNNSPSAHRRVSRFPATGRGRQSGHFLETGSLYLPPAALRLFPPSANRILEFAKNTHFGGCSFFTTGGLLLYPS